MRTTLAEFSIGGPGEVLQSGQEIWRTVPLHSSGTGRAAPEDVLCQNFRLLGRQAERTLAVWGQPFQWWCLLQWASLPRTLPAGILRPHQGLLYPEPFSAGPLLGWLLFLKIVSASLLPPPRSYKCRWHRRHWDKTFHLPASSLYPYHRHSWFARFSSVTQSHVSSMGTGILSCSPLYHQPLAQPLTPRQHSLIQYFLKKWIMESYFPLLHSNFKYSTMGSS